MRVSGSDWLYAIGDVNGRSLLTHMAKYQARVAGDVILGRPARAIHDGPGAPRVIFTDPEVAAVGHTLATAKRPASTFAPSTIRPRRSRAQAIRGRNAPGTSRLVVDERRTGARRRDLHWT